MRIAIIGYGRMGRMVEQLARDNGHTIVAIVDPLVTSSAVVIHKSVNEIKESSIDAAIVFSLPSSAVTNIFDLIEKKIPIVMGTTGWYERLDEVTEVVKNSGTSLIWSPNFSIGVNLFYRIAWHAAELINKFDEYDAGGFEAHHNKKLDSPSGTAKTLAEGIISRMDRKNKIVWETLNRKPETDELHFPSLRMGNVPGTHSVFFDSAADTIEITHTARSREGFASGAVRAAQWLTAEKRQGVFTIDDMLYS